ncbi:MAG: CARDB domain-containing protein, partial [Myxococcota bacterium]
MPTNIAPGASGRFMTRIDNIAVGFTGDVDYRLFASNDDSLDVTDTTLGTFSVSFDRETTVSDTQTVVFPATLGPDTYFIFAVVDPDNALPELSDTNNDLVAEQQIANALDFSVADVEVAPETIAVGQTITVQASFFNRGLPFTGNVPVSIVLSQDSTPDVGDQAIFRGFVFFPGRAATGVQTYTFDLAALPGEPQLVPEQYTIIVVVDPEGQYAEATRTNNSANADESLTIVGSDLLIDDMTVVSPAFINGELNVRITLANEDIADAVGFRYAYYLSTNRIIRLRDTQIFLSDPIDLASGERRTIEDSVPLPTFTTTTALYVGVIVDIFSQVPELVETNNTRTADVLLTDGTELGIVPVEFRQPIPDLTIRLTETPDIAGAGEDIALSRLIANEGAAPAAGFSYSYYLSTNPTISPIDDILLFTGTSSLAVGQEDFGIDTFALPADLPGGDYFVGAIVDTEAAFEEVLETNNIFTGPQLTVVPTAIQFFTRDLPDGTID